MDPPRGRGAGGRLWPALVMLALGALAWLLLRPDGPSLRVTVPRGNLVANPSFEYGPAGWDTLGGKLEILRGSSEPEGAHVAQVSFAGAPGAAYSLTPLPDTIVPRTKRFGRYTAAAWVRAAPGSAGRPLVLAVREWRGGREIARAAAAVTLAAGRYQPVSVTFVAHRSGDRLDAYLFRPQNTGTRAGEAFLADAFSLVAAAQVVPASPPGLAPCPERWGFSAAQPPPPCWRPYGPQSPFNRLLPLHPRLAAGAGAIRTYMLAQGWSLPADSDGNFSLADGARPVYFSGPADPLVRVRCRGGYPCLPRLRLRVPRGALPQAESDGHMTVVDRAAGVEYDFWQATTPRDGSMSVSAASAIPIGPNRGTGRGGGADAAGLGLLAGMIRAGELRAGVINHALAITVPCESPHDVWPATPGGLGDQICPGSAAAPALGSLLVLDMSDAQIAASGAPTWQQAVMRAMAHYGLYVVDSSGPGERTMSLVVQNDRSFTSFGYPGQMHEFVQAHGGNDFIPLAGTPLGVDRLRMVDPCVPRGTCR